MAEFFLELFSEEIPAGLQKNLRERLLLEFQNFFLWKSIKSKKSFSLSTPHRLILEFEGLDKELKISSEKIREPTVVEKFKMTAKKKENINRASLKWELQKNKQ